MTARLGRWLALALATWLALPGCVPPPPPPPGGSPGCGGSTAGAVTEQQRTIVVGGTSRSYLLTIPPQHDGTTPVPVVMDFHGLAEGSVIHARHSAFSAEAIEEGFVVVFPHGTGNPVRWNASATATPNQDLALVDAIRAELGTWLCIDTTRTYATGLSYGAFFTSLLTCTRSDVFAAVAPVAGVQTPTPCAQARDVPVLTFHGTADTILPFNGPGQPVDLDGPGYPANVARWAERNGCDPTPTDTELTDEVVHRVYDCPAGADVELYVVLGGGHTWPGSEFSRSIESVVGYTTFDIDATELAWEFFERFHT
jgi:polyhydroxybutyrate depolymerase